jgi:hypothetical protein
LDRGRKTKIVYTLLYDQAPLGTDKPRRKTGPAHQALHRSAGKYESDGGISLMIRHIAVGALRPKFRKELEARYRSHGKADFDKVAGIVRGCVTNGHSGPPPEMIDRMPKLEIIASASVGYDGIPVEYARSKGIRSPTHRMC